MSQEKVAKCLAMSVLVVEDDAALRTLFLALLEREGFDVECVTNGADALKKLEDKSYAVMLLDLMMPVTNGFDVLRELAANEPPLLRRTIVTTGVSERDLSRIDSGSVFGVLRKPFDINCLVSMITDCARQSARHRSRATKTMKPPDDDPGDSSLDGPASRLASALPQLRQLLRCAALSDRELLLRGELRQAVNRCAGMLAAAAALERNTARAERLAQLAESALSLTPHLPATARVTNH